MADNQLIPFSTDFGLAFAVPLPHLASWGSLAEELRDLAADDWIAFPPPIEPRCPEQISQQPSCECARYQVLQWLLSLKLVWPETFAAIDRLIPAESVLETHEIPGSPDAYLNDFTAAWQLVDEANPKRSDSPAASVHRPGGRTERSWTRELPRGSVFVYCGDRTEPTRVQRQTIGRIQTDERHIEQAFLALLSRDLMCRGDERATERFGKCLGEAPYLPLPNDVNRIRDATNVECLFLSPVKGRWAIGFASPWYADDEHGDLQIACVENDRFVAVWPGEWIDCVLWL